MNNWKRYTSLLLALVLCLSMAGCGSSGRKWRDDDVIDDYGTITRNGKQIDVCVCHDLEVVYLYCDNEKHDYFETAMLPTEELYDKDWSLDVAEFYDFNDDGNSDLQVALQHADMRESYIVWIWEEGEGYVYAPDYSWFYESGAINDPDDDAADFSVYEGTWLGDADDTQSVTYIEFNGEGIWQLYSDGESIDQGYLWYDSEDDAVYIHSDLGGAADGGRVELEGDRLYITTLGYFTHIVSEEDQDYTDFSAYEGTWYLDEDSSAEAYVIIDGDGSWSYCRRAAGEDAATEIDRGTLSDSGEADILYADSAVNDGVRYLVFEMDENILIWGDEGAYYRIVG